MKLTKKLLSLFLAVVMVLSAFTVIASAYTVGAADENKINVKYEVEKVASASMIDGSGTYTGDDIYAVTAYAKATKGIDTFTVPVHFNKDHFSPILYIDGADMYVGTDTWAGDYGVDNGVYSLGAAMNNTGMYDAAGTIVDKKINAKAFGLGNENATKPAVKTEYISPDHSLFGTWHAGLENKVGVMYVQIDGSKNAKTCYLNVTSGITPNPDWVSIITFYFQRNPGVTDDAVLGDEFGVYTNDCYTVDGTVDGSGYGYYTAATYSNVGYNPEKNVVSNAVVKKWAPAISKLNSQMRFNGTETAGKGSANFDVRTRAQVSKADLAKAIGCEVADLEATLKNNTNIRIGFVYQPSTGSFDPTAAKAAAIAGVNQNGYTVKNCKYVGDSGDNIVWTCLIKNANYNGDVTALPYIIVGSEAYFLDGEPITCDFSAAYDILYPRYTASLS